MKRARHQKPPKPGKPATSALVQIEKPIYGGAFLTRIEGKATFVPLTLPGEQARVRVVEDKRSFASAEPEEIVLSSADRVAPRCPHFGVCGGCSYQHSAYPAQLALKEAILRETLGRAGVPVPEEISVLAENPWEYRNRIRLGFDAAGEPGYRGRRSHEIIRIRECPISAPSLVRAALSMADLIRQVPTGIRPTEISLFCNADETGMLASVFLREKTDVGRLDRFAQSWAERAGAVSGIEFVVAESRQRIGHSMHVWGERSLTYRVGDIDYRVGYGAFFQVNRWLLDTFVDSVISDRAGALAWDLFAGVGLFARRLANRFDQVVAVESSLASIPALTANLQGTSGICVDADILSFLQARSRATKPDVIVVDPPRTGLGPEITSLLADVAASSVVYISCDPATLARDLRGLIGSGYRIVSVTLADLFPQTFHLETVVELQRS